MFICKSDIRERGKNHQFVSSDRKGQIPHQILRNYKTLLSAVFFQNQNKCKTNIDGKVLKGGFNFCSQGTKIVSIIALINL